MLVLTRKPGERLHVGDDITVSVLEVRGNRVRIGIEAPKHVRVVRAELREWENSPLDTRSDRRAALVGS